MPLRISQANDTLSMNHLAPTILVKTLSADYISTLQKQEEWQLKEELVSTVEWFIFFLLGPKFFYL